MNGSLSHMANADTERINRGQTVQGKGQHLPTRMRKLRTHITGMYVACEGWSGRMWGGRGREGCINWTISQDVKESLIGGFRRYAEFQMDAAKNPFSNNVDKEWRGAIMGGMESTAVTFVRRLVKVKKCGPWLMRNKELKLPVFSFRVLLTAFWVILLESLGYPGLW